MKKILFCLILLLNGVSFAAGELLIVVHVYNRPDFIELQHRCFQKFLEDDYEMIVFNDAPPGPMHDALTAKCKEFDITCIPIPQWIHDKPHPVEAWNKWFCVGSKRHTEGLKYFWEKIGYDFNGIVALFDSDLFLIRPFSIKNALKDYEIASAIRDEKGMPYLWPGLSFVKVNKLPNKQELVYDCGEINNEIVDSGGYTYFYLKNNPNVRLNVLDNYLTCTMLKKENTKNAALREMNIPKDEWNFIRKMANYEIQLLHENTFIHYGRASNYLQKKEDYMRLKSSAFDNFMQYKLTK